MRQLDETLQSIHVVSRQLYFQHSGGQEWLWLWIRMANVRRVTHRTTRSDNDIYLLIFNSLCDKHCKFPMHLVLFASHRCRSECGWSSGAWAPTTDVWEESRPSFRLFGNVDVFTLFNPLAISIPPDWRGAGEADEKYSLTAICVLMIAKIART